MRRACIDIGSNTTRLLVADCSDGELVECGQERVFNQIGRSLDGNGEIPQATLQEIAAVVAQQLDKARQLGAQQIRCVATAGIRRARNGAALTGLVADLADGLELEILSGEQEARFAFAGAVWATGPRPDAVIAVVDAGGGSTELVVGSAPGDVRWWESLPVGSGDLTGRWLRSDPPAAHELESAGAEVAAHFEPVSPPAGVERVIAVGGSASSMRVLAGPVLDATALGLIRRLCERLSAAEVAHSFGVDVQRARLLAGGALILSAASALFGAPLEVGGGGLREGVLLAGDGHS